MARGMRLPAPACLHRLRPRSVQEFDHLRLAAVLCGLALDQIRFLRNSNALLTSLGTINDTSQLIPARTRNK